MEGIEPSVGPETVVVGVPRVVVECLLALAELARGGAAAVEGDSFWISALHISSYESIEWTRWTVRV